MKAKLSAKGAIVLPAKFRRQDRIRTGQQFEVNRMGAGEYLLRRISEPPKPGLMKWLNSCPEKDWFQPLP